MASKTKRRGGIGITIKAYEKKGRLIVQTGNVAAGSHRKMDTSIVFPGSTRAVVISKLGAPEISRKFDDGTKQEW